MFRKAFIFCTVWFVADTLAVTAFSSGGVSSSFVHRKPLFSHAKQLQRQGIASHSYGRRKRHSQLCMRDASASYWFQVGDTVRVVADDVEKAGINLENRIGTVVETWEKCDVDPTCCCAEQVDINMAVRVEFPGTETNPQATGASFFHYFAEEELVKATAIQEEPKDDTATTTNSLPFDGMSCTAFKMEQIQSASSQQPRGIANWEPAAQQPSQDQEPTDIDTTTTTTNSVPFDGVSCTAFKLDQLQSAGQKPRGIANWEPAAQPSQEED